MNWLQLIGGKRLEEVEIEIDEEEPYRTLCF